MFIFLFCSINFLNLNLPYFLLPANILPKDESELYQLCYVTVDESVMGASIPFTFRRPLESELIGVEDKANNGLIIYKSRVALLHDKISGVRILYFI